MLFSIPLWCGVLLTGLSTLVLLAFQQYGVRKLEFLIAFLVFTIATCFLVELGYAKPNSSEVLHGLFVPHSWVLWLCRKAVSIRGIPFTSWIWFSRSPPSKDIMVVAFNRTGF
ncbi:hypothetical protein F0562_023332 [Nyssa sinensis]|uniref:Uncharacterized protein n=1 Tax=Nyssa sinensis TaxID=561372 RepID=A0A5J5BIT9_9ASTE|nr:hypothetical protein F0562_023332 [Nyssa sinensis]